MILFSVGWPRLLCRVLHQSRDFLRSLGSQCGCHLRLFIERVFVWSTKSSNQAGLLCCTNCNNCRSLNESRSKNRNQRSLLRPTSITSRPFPDLSENWQFPFEISRVELSRMEIWKQVHQFYQTRRRLQPSKVFYTVRKHNYFVSPPTVWNDRPWKI